MTTKLKASNLSTGSVTGDAIASLAVTPAKLSTGGIHWDSSGKVGINTTSPACSLDINTTNSIKIPVGTTAERPTPATGMIRYNTDDDTFEGHNGTDWGAIGGGGATGGGSDQVFIENGMTVTTSYTLTAGKSAISVGPITISDAAAVTVPPGARWVIL